jgi:sodium bicarbonate transporter 10
LEPPAGTNEKERELQEDEEDVIDDDRRNREASGLVRTGRLFGGLINDIKRRVLPSAPTLFYVGHL